jgi:hypothetical protein
MNQYNIDRASLATYQKELSELKQWDSKITKPLPPIIQHWRNRWVKRINRLYEQHVINVLREEQRTTQDKATRIPTSP